MTATRRPNPYNNRAWRKFRAAFLAEHPRCVVCGGRASVVDHVIDWKAAGTSLFPALPAGTPTFQALCASDHSRKSGFLR